MIGYLVLGCWLGLSMIFNYALLMHAFRLAHALDAAEAKLREADASKALDDVYDAIRHRPAPPGGEDV